MVDTSQSLLLRAGTGDPGAWERLDTLYRPLVRGWLARHNVPPQEADDLTQDVLFTVARGIEGFRHAGPAGSFRGWLRTIAVNRAREYWRAGRLRTAAAGGDAFRQALEELADPASIASSAWERQHDESVVRRLLDLLAEEFEPQTMRAFRLVTFDGRSGSEAAAELGISAAAVYMAKSRVLNRLRAEAAGLLD
jgi:RNA polymerase sigma factor (sigma-70 family)